MKKILGLILFGLLGILSSGQVVNALEVVGITSEQTAVNLSDVIEYHHDKQDALTVQTIPDANGIVSRIEVRATNPETSGSWAVFALANTTDQQIDRLIVAPHFRLAGSGAPIPDLGNRRLVAITPSEGFALDRQTDPNADIFRVTLNPGAVITFVAELEDPRIPQLNLWEPDAYKDAVNSYTLYKGITIGIAGLLALFLTILFLVKGSLVFPAAATLAWAVLAYISLDFGFLSKIVSTTPQELSAWRAVTEMLLCVSFIGFIYAYLHLNQWNAKYSYILAAWVAGLVILAGTAIGTPEISAGIIRIFFGLSTIIGLAIITWFAIKKFDKAILIIPTWIFVIVWTAAAWATINGQINNDIIQPALSGALVLILLLISFNVMQHAFADNILISNLVSDVELQALALTGSDDAVWDWEVNHNNIFIGEQITKKLGYQEDEVNGSPDKWLNILHNDDQQKFQTILNVILKHKKGKLNHTIRVRDKNQKYQWMEINAKPVVGSDGEVIRCVGTIRDVTEQKNTQDRLMIDAIHDNITGVPNRELFVDRTKNAINIAKHNKNIIPAIVVIEIQNINYIRNRTSNAETDLAIVTVVRRIEKHIQPQDCIARTANDQISLLIMSQNKIDKIKNITNNIHSEVSEKIVINESQINFDSVIGIAQWNKQDDNIIQNAQIAALQAKNEGGNKIKEFQPNQKTNAKNQAQDEIKNAIKQNQIIIEYQPIIHLKTKKIAGFKAIPKWEHPKNGAVYQDEFINSAEKNNLIVPLNLFIINNAVEQLTIWRKGCPNAPIFIAIDIMNHKIINQETVSDITAILKKHRIAPNRLKLEITENCIMKNPNNAINVLRKIKNTGVGVAVNEFGTGYSTIQNIANMPVDTIKINQKYHSNYTTLKYISNMAGELKLKIIAVNANTENDIEMSKRIGCEYAQGGVFGSNLNPKNALLALQRQYERKQVQA